MIHFTMRRAPAPALALLLIAGATSAFTQVKLPPSRKTVLPNGVTLLLMEQHETPVVSMSIALRTGSVADPAGKEGLAAAVNDLLRKGSKTRDADTIARELDFIGATFFTRESADALALSAEFLKKDTLTGIDLVADILLNPVFPQAEIDKLLKQRQDGVRAAKDQAGAVMGQYFNAFLFGEHPYGRPGGGDERSLKAITREDVARFYGEHYVSGNMIVAAAGDFETAAMEKVLTARFGALPKKPAATAVLAKPERIKGRKVLLIDKPDSTQTYFRMGNVGIARADPDRVVIDVVNTLFGGRFTSILNNALRVESGLTYGASSSFDRRAEPGPFFINTYTRNATTEKAMDMTLFHLGQLHEKGLTEDQLKSAKAYIKGQFGPRVESSDQLAGWLVDLERFGLTAAEVDEYAARLDKVTVAETRRVIRQHYPIENMVVVMIGKASEIAPMAKKYGATVETKSIADPGFK